MTDLKFRKLKAEEIDIRIGRVIKTNSFSGATLLLYKDARVDMAILDETVGPMNWQRKHTRENANCSVGIYNEERSEWIWKEDTGTESFAEAEKGLASDSFKRACVNWGIGRELYTAKNILVACKLDSDGKKPLNGTSWYVKTIEYAGEEISQLVIVEKYRDEEKEVFWLKPRKDKKEERPQPCSSQQIERMRELNINEPNVLKRFNVSSIEALSYQQAEFVINAKEKALEKEGK